ETIGGNTRGSSVARSGEFALEAAVVVSRATVPFVVATFFLDCCPVARTNSRQVRLSRECAKRRQLASKATVVISWPAVSLVVATCVLDRRPLARANAGQIGLV